ncbi:MAG: hypothetical protein OXD32_03135 [Endozoicomonadaceae bacterium]|nr:hypothetical protein [Endozoicomonadaceae bacterium]
MLTQNPITSGDNKNQLIIVFLYADNKYSESSPHRCWQGDDIEIASLIPPVWF